MLCLLCRDFLPVTRDDGAGGLEVRGFVARQPLLLLPAGALGPEPEPEAAADAAAQLEAAGAPRGGTSAAHEEGVPPLPSAEAG